MHAARGIEMLAVREAQLYGWNISFHKVQHGANGYSYALRFASEEKVWVYMPDAFQVSEEQFVPFRDLDLLILGAAPWQEEAEPHRRSIYDVQEALIIGRKLRAKRLLLTHMSHGVDILRHAEALPANVEFAFDGMEICI